jgi:hypothetical protein
MADLVDDAAQQLDLARRRLRTVEKLRRSDSQSIEAERNLIRETANELQGAAEGLLEAVGLLRRRIDALEELE